MPSWRAAAWARAPSRDAMPTISPNFPACMLGITRLTAMFATPNTPHRTFFMTWQLYRGGSAGGGGAPSRGGEGGGAQAWRGAAHGGYGRGHRAGAARYSEISCGDCWRDSWRSQGFGAPPGISFSSLPIW